MTISFQEFKPSPILQPFVESYWMQVFNGAPGEESPLVKCPPLGMTHIVFHVVHNNCQIQVNNEWKGLPAAYFIGVYEEPACWKTQGYSVVFGMNLTPESLVQLFNIPASALYNNYVDVSSFLNTRTNAVEQQMMGITDPYKLISVVETYLLNRLKDIQAQRSYVTEATKLIRHAKGNITIDALCKNLFVSERQLQRTFKDALGTSPKMYTRLVRFKNAYQYVQEGRTDKISWASLSYHFGYADQAHFIRDFKEFTGEKPSFVAGDTSQFFQLSTGILA